MHELFHVGLEIHEEDSKEQEEEFEELMIRDQELLQYDFDDGYVDEYSDWDCHEDSHNLVIVVGDVSENNSDGDSNGSEQAVNHYVDSGLG